MGGLRCTNPLHGVESRRAGFAPLLTYLRNPLHGVESLSGLLVPLSGPSLESITWS